MTGGGRSMTVLSEIKLSVFPQYLNMRDWRTEPPPPSNLRERADRLQVPPPGLSRSNPRDPGVLNIETKVVLTAIVARTLG